MFRTTKSRDHDVVVVRRTIDLRCWEFGMGREWEGGGQFTSNLGPRWTESHHVKEALLPLLSKYLKDLETDEKDGLSSDVVKTWKQAMLDLTADILKNVGRMGVNPASGPDDALGPLRKAIGKIASLTEAVTTGVQEPDEEELRDLARKLGAAKKDIMTMSRGLVVNQSATLATEAHELASKAGEVIRAS
jgi:hypothetical protein